MNEVITMADVENFKARDLPSTVAFCDRFGSYDLCYEQSLRSQGSTNAESDALR